ncbi:MAG: dihydrofolate reductase [Ruminococcus sp.]|nr:dihydrofolate reductase [Ruminococcus sp.]MCM1480808.1 dihydrofolate reductase [Muribaculaceae bacterium]
MITAIAAVSENWGIGRNNDLLFNIPDDKKFFRRTTLKHTVIMGRHTLLSLPGGKPFKDRRNIVLTRKKDFECEGAEVCQSIDEVLAKLDKDEESFVVGGGQVYRDMLPYCERAIITRVSETPEAEVFFPNLDEHEEWSLSVRSEELEHEGLKYRFCVYIHK